MRYTTVVKVVEEGSNRPLQGLHVSLFDRDTVSRDDLLGSGETDAGGEVRFDYNSEHFVDMDDRVGGVFPELYAVVYRPASVAFGEVRIIDGQPTQMVVFTDAEAQRWLALYPMQRQGDGSWKIDGCIIERVEPPKRSRGYSS